MVSQDTVQFLKTLHFPKIDLDTGVRFAGAGRRRKVKQRGGSIYTDIMGRNPYDRGIIRNFRGNGRKRAPAKRKAPARRRQTGAGILGTLLSILN
jgi:hypothetical protein